MSIAAANAPQAPMRARWVALAGLCLVALNLRIAVAVVAPTSGFIRADINLGHGVEELVGMAPPLVFAIVGAFAAKLGRRFGLENMILVAMGISAAGELARALSNSSGAFLVWTVAIMAGAGLGNVLCPPLIKKYFPDHLGVVTGAYTVGVTLSAGLPPLFVVRLATAAGWRPALGIWAVLAIAAIAPWLWIVARRGWAARSAAATEAAPISEPSDQTGSSARLWRNGAAWALAVVFACTSFVSYSLFAWLPDVLRAAGYQDGAAATYLAALSLTALPGALLVPIIVSRMRRLWLLPPIFAAGYVVAFAGLALSPAHGTLAWILFSRLGECFFPMAITLITLRSRTTAGASALSGFVQSVGYVLASAGPWLVGALFTLAGEWRVPMLALLAVVPIQLVAALTLTRGPTTTAG